MKRRPARRLVVGVVAAALAVGSMTACGDDDGGSTITVWHGYTDVEAGAITAAVAEWNAQHPGTPVDLVFDGGNDSALQKTVASAIAGKLPDVAYEYGSSVAQLSRQPRLVDLTHEVAGNGWNWDDFFPSERAAATTPDGKVVGVPALVDNLALVYDKKAFAAAGIPEPTDTWSWQQFRAAAKQLSDPGDGRFGWAYVNDGSEDTVWRWLAMLWQAGGDLLDSSNTHAAFDSDAGRAALDQLRDMAVTDRSVYLDDGSGNYLNLFNSGKIAMLWTGPWDLSSINDDVDYGVTYLPGYDGDHQTISGPDLYLSFRHSDGRQATSLAFLKWLTSPEEHLKFAIATGDLPLRQSETQLPGYQQFLDTYPGNAVFVSNLDNVEKVRPNIPTYSQVSSVIGQMVQSVLLGQQDPDDALRIAAAQVTTIVQGDV